MLRTRFIFQVLPFTSLGLLVSGLGAWAWPVPASIGATILRALFVLLSFLGLLALKRTPNWNVFMLLVFSFQLGAFASWLEPDTASGSWGWVLFAALVWQSFSLIVGHRWRIRSSEVGMALWLLTWAYLLGWAVLILFRMDPVFQRVWAGFGLVLFGGMSAAWSSEAERLLDRNPGSALGIELYMLTISVVVAARILFLDSGALSIGSA